MTAALMDTYKRLPVQFDRGEGPWLWDGDGRRYLDLVSGLAVCGLGHAHPRVTRAISEQAGRLLHTSNLYGIPHQDRLAARLTGISGMQEVFFCNSGAEANEAAIKLARAYGHRRGVEIPTIVVAEGSFHGRTLATLAATGNPKVQAGFEPLVQGFLRVPYGDLRALEAAVADRPEVVAVLVEPITGEGGVVVPPADFLPGLRALCDRQGWLMMLDEVQTGMGRTGRWFACAHEGVLPDVMTVAKALGNGVPIGACLARGPAAGVLGPGMHGSTFGGNPLVCSAALAVIDTIEEEGLLARAEAAGRRLTERLRAVLEGLNCVVEVRGRGLMLAVELDRPCAELVPMGMERGLLLNVTAERVLRLLPPLVLSDSEIDAAAEGIGALIRAWNAGGEAAS